MNFIPAIETRNLSICFGGHVAVDSLNMKVEPFCLKSIIGPNGAGKTTLFNLISGQYKPSSGQILFNGKEVTRMGVAKRAKLGIGRSFQLTNIFPNLSALENVRIAAQSTRNIGMVFWKDYKCYPELEETAFAFLSQVGLEDKYLHEARLLTHGEQRKLEIAILLALDPKVLLLDEPTAGMSLEDVPGILEIIQKIKSLKTRTILLVEHKFDMIM
ncbi:MAG: ABC transporter ATP-binding protein, partial [Proteobacteria bacterium]|nr:ABC transporter ATP-binding protein [Pseudomonadota bacterium]